MFISLARIALGICALFALFDWFGVTWVHVFSGMVGLTYVMVCDVYDDIKGMKQ